LALTLTGVKNIRRNDRRRHRNKAIKSALRTQMRKVLESVKKKDKAASAEGLKAAYKLLDRAAASKTIHRNAAARYKSRLATKVAGVAK
jgi:small subunit ribosomal protein S20